MWSPLVWSKTRVCKVIYHRQWANNWISEDVLNHHELVWWGDDSCLRLSGIGTLWYMFMQLSFTLEKRSEGPRVCSGSRIKIELTGGVLPVLCTTWLCESYITVVLYAAIRACARFELATWLYMHITSYCNYQESWSCILAFKHRRKWEWHVSNSCELMMLPIIRTELEQH